MKAAMTQPVRPFPPLQCTTTTCCGSESSHDFMEPQTEERRSREGARWSGHPKSSTCLERRGEGRGGEGRGGEGRGGEERGGEGRGGRKERDDERKERGSRRGGRL